LKTNTLGEIMKTNTLGIEVNHFCFQLKNALYESCGSAIDSCEEDLEGKMWAGNGEYESQVNFCPICGQQATVQIEKE